jgi:hypothetical protein
MKRSLYFISTILCSFCYQGYSQEKITVGEYIDLYKDIAVEEMKQYHIPASITLAQGILESENGNSELAQKANNHFGIKCHKEWTGRTFIQDDDEKDECFRKYQKADESYRDHSEFLTTRDRYKFLFDLDITDYKSWAYGLKQAGYATNPRYPELLIRIIEENGLDLFDKAGSRQSAVGGQNQELTTGTPTTFEISGRGGNNRIIFINNGVKFILAREGDTFYGIATEFNIYTWQVYAYNDLAKQDRLITGQKVYLEKKKRKGEADFHIIRRGETLQSISQDYGIRLKALCKRNQKLPGDKLTEGEAMILR